MKKTIMVPLLLIILVLSIMLPAVQGREEQMIISLDSTLVVEGQAFSALVKDTAGNPIQGVILTFYLIVGEEPYRTNANGIATLIAPGVSHTTQVVINATKEGYEDTTASITVIDTSQRQLQINAPEVVIEGDTFSVSITVAASLPVNLATVTAFGIISTTDSNGLVSLTAPQVTQQTPYTITASKNGFLENNIQIIVEDTSPPIQKQLQLTVPETIEEGQQIQILVTSQGFAVPNAIVTFNDQTYTTDSNGIVTVVAPLVEVDTNYLVTTTKDAYEPASTTIIVTNQEPMIKQGWIIGKITDISNSPLSNVRVFATNLTSEIREQTITDIEGTYNLTLPVGTYQINASKQGYSKSEIYQVMIQDKTTSQRNFILEKETKDTMDYVVQWGVENDIIGAEITFPQDATQDITIYNEAITIHTSIPTQRTFSVTVTAPAGTQGTVLVLKIEDTDTLFEKTIENLQDLIITYDGEVIPMVQNLEDIFEPPENTTHSAWAASITENGLYVIVSIPHFSTHTITVSTFERISDISGSTALIFYVSIFGLILVVAGIHMKRVWRR